MPKTEKMVFDASLLNTQHCKVRIKGKVDHSRERSCALDYSRQLYLYIYIYIYIYLIKTNGKVYELFLFLSSCQIHQNLPFLQIYIYIYIYHINSVIYKYTCSCGSDYVGRTSNRLDLHIRQHLPDRILNLRLIRGQLANTSGSSIAEHMINSRECVADFNVDRFSIPSRSHSLFHLKVLETLYVRSLQPSLCKQRDCLLGLNVISL